MTATRRVLRFYLLALALSWLAWLPLVLGLRASPYLHFVGAFGPATAAFAVALQEGPAFRRFAARVVRAPARWVAFAVGLPIAIYLGAVAFAMMFGDDLDLARTGTHASYPGLGVAGYAVASIACFGFGEEIGWRGYALPILLERMSPRRASLVVAAGWTLWHVPLFAFTGLGAMPAIGLVGWLASMIAGSMFATWLYLRSRGSIVALALFHGVLDITINSPVGGSVQMIMGAIVTFIGFASVHLVQDAVVCEPN